ncbi:hypothetical protein [Thalassolituus oleivorans]|uniref:hypothetical protein n=1 Tax=Thalassolituus oleivorans TaxID=187493 RepID=UPI00042DBF22|nr:hypothetical protein [Thalassolituus oleivorans]AHK15125.1 hypothetical protein R615_03870 [Thalassolituus oleivorans R6-15]MCA6128318.1 hypothetical protein [Thalassolituus oleivorans 4BN06-13]
MKLLNTYDDRETAESAALKITGEKRLASERDGTETIYNLFGQPTWANFYKLGMFNLPQLKEIVDQRQAGQPYDETKHQGIISMLKYAAKQFELEIPEHWL